jgi:hypothetical protein
MKKVSLVWVDFKPIAWRCWYHILTSGHIATVNDERVEFLKAMELHAHKLKTWFPDAYFYIAADHHSWRKKFVKEWWGERELQMPFEGFAPDETETGIYYAVEGKFHHVSKSPQGKIWGAKVSKKDMPKEIEWNTSEPTEDQLELLAWAREPKPQWRQQYKGSRALKKWSHETTMDQFNELASHYALHWTQNVLGGTLHLAQNMEADDIIAQGLEDLKEEKWVDKDNKVVVVTSDHDIRQCGGENIYFLGAQYDEMVSFTEEDAAELAWEKVLLGDSSDEYSCCLKSGGTRMTAGPVNKIAHELIWGDTDPDELLADVNPEFLERNMRIALIPQEDHKEILRKAIREPVDIEITEKFEDLTTFDQHAVAAAEAREKEASWGL